MSDIKIIQWNIKGFCNNYYEMQLLIKEHKPHIICLQETHCTNYFNPIIPKNYIGYFENYVQNITAKQGVGLLIKNNISHKILNINSNLQIIAIEVLLKIKITIISIYIPPTKSFSSNELNNIFTNINTPMLFLGDVNSWSTLWGARCNNNRGDII